MVEMKILTISLWPG